MSIYGPVSKNPPQYVDLTQLRGNLDMNDNKITNLATPRMRSDAATAGYVRNFVSHLQNAKVNWTGGTMTGDLSMGGNKLTNLGVPEDAGDAVNKQ
jgi:hypothetical protein